MARGWVDAWMHGWMDDLMFGVTFARPADSGTPDQPKVASGEVHEDRLHAIRSFGPEPEKLRGSQNPASPKNR